MNSSNNLQLWDRDEAILRELGRSFMLRQQVGRLFCFSQKKCGERLYMLWKAGLVKRTQAFQLGMQGRVEYGYWAGDIRSPAPPAMRHTIMVAELRVQARLSFPDHVDEV